ncbi:MAG: DMT family transporter [Lachnospiraceae bacterium]|nr:DMT family transporter [Lachnospiraceae bacterium]
MSLRARSIVLLFLTALIWGFAFVAQRVGGDILGAFYFNGIRYAVGAVSLIPVIMIFEKERKNPEKLKYTIKWGIVVGLILFIASSLQQFGINITQSAGKSGFITGLYTVLVPLIGFVFFKYKTNLFTWVGAALAVVGLFLLSFTSGVSPVGIGDIVLLIGSVFWAMHIIVIDKVGSGASSIKFSMTQFLTSSVCCLLFALLTKETITFEAVRLAGTSILYAGIMSSGVAYTFQVIGQKHVEPSLAAIICSSEALFSAVGGALILGESMTMRSYIGCALMFAGIIVSQLKPKRAQN